MPTGRDIGETPSSLYKSTDRRPLVISRPTMIVSQYGKSLQSRPGGGGCFLFQYRQTRGVPRARVCLQLILPSSQHTLLSVQVGDYQQIA